MDKDDIIDIVKLVTGIEQYETNITRDIGVYGVNHTGEVVFMWWSETGTRTISWLINTTEVTVQDVLNPNLSEEAKLEIILRYG